MSSGNKHAAGILNRAVLIAYGLPALVTSFPLIPFAVYLPAYYAEDKGLGFFAVGITLFLSRLIDVLSDPIVGYLSDRFPLFAARRKGWMILGALISAPALYMLSVPAADPSIWYLGIWAAILYVGWTMIMVPYLALAADLAQSYSENNKLSLSRETFSLMGTLVALLLPFVFSGHPLEIIPYVVIPAGLVVFTLLWQVIPEDDQPSSEHSFGAGDLLQILQTPFTRRLCVVWFLTATASAIPAALFPVYINNVLQGTETEKGILIFVYFVAAVVGMPFFGWYTNNKFKHKVMAASMVAVCMIFPFATLLSAGDMVFFGVICVGTGFALAGELLLGPSMLADATVLYEQKEGKNLAASHFALWGMLSKIAFAVAILLAFGLMEVISLYSSETTSPFMVALLYAGLPITFKLPAAKLLFSAPFTANDRDLVTREIRIQSI